MKCRSVRNNDGIDFDLTESEERYVRAIERIEKMNNGRLSLFANGHLSIRIDGNRVQNEIISTDIFCEGGDGGDRF